MDRLCLECRDISYGNDGSPCMFSNLSFSVKRGTQFFICGENGSGKTSLLKICAGIIPPHNGTVLCRERVDYLGHENALHLELTLGENLRFWEKLLKKQFMQELISCFNLSKFVDLPVKYLSFGQKRKVALGRVLLGSNAKLILLDEPFQGLDQSTQNVATEFMHQQMKKEVSFVVSTHNPCSDGNAICLS